MCQRVHVQHFNFLNMYSITLSYSCQDIASIFLNYDLKLNRPRNKLFNWACSEMCLSLECVPVIQTPRKLSSCFMGSWASITLEIISIFSFPAKGHRSLSTLLFPGHAGLGFALTEMWFHVWLQNTVKESQVIWTCGWFGWEVTPPP